MSLSTEEREQRLRRCAPYVETAAEQLRAVGHPKAAAVLDAIHAHGPEDMHRAGALSVAAMEALPEEERHVAQEALYMVADEMVKAGDNRNVQPLVTWLEETGDLYGLPGEDTDAA